MSYLNYAEDVEDMASLSELGYMVIGLGGFGNKSIFAKDFLTLVQGWIKTQPPLAGRSISLYAKGPKAVEFLAAAAQDNSIQARSFGLVLPKQEKSDPVLQEEVKKLIAQYKCCMIGIAIGDDERFNQISHKLADGWINDKAEKRGCKKILEQQSSSTQGKFILGYYDMLEKNNLPDPMGSIDCRSRGVYRQGH
jgi:hypothetical protein